MKILQITASYKPAYIYGGPTMSVSKLSEELVKAGQDVRVISTRANGVSELDVIPGKEQIVDGVSVIYFNRLTKDHSQFSPALLKYLFKVLNNSTIKQLNNNPTLIHIHAWWNLISVLSCLIAILKSKTVILSPRGTLSSYSFGNRNNFYKKLIHVLLGKPLLKRCHFHVTSEKEKEDILKLLKPRSITVIPNFVRLEVGNEEQEQGAGSTSAETTKESLNNDLNTIDTSDTSQISLRNTQYPIPKSLKLLFLSRIEEKKGLNLLFHALADCKFSWELTIAGNGNPNYISKLKELAAGLNLQESIHWAGQKNPDEKFETIKTHDLLVLPSHDENFANVVIESLAMGTPVLLSKNVGLADYVELNNFGWICSIDPKELAETIEAAFKDHSKRILIRKKAPEKIREDFNDKVLVKKYMEFYLKLS